MSDCQDEARRLILSHGFNKFDRLSAFLKAQLEIKGTSLELGTDEAYYLKKNFAVQKRKETFVCSVRQEHLQTMPVMSCLESYAHTLDESLASGFDSKLQLYHFTTKRQDGISNFGLNQVKSVNAAAWRVVWRDFDLVCS